MENCSCRSVGRVEGLRGKCVQLVLDKHVHQLTKSSAALIYAHVIMEEVCKSIQDPGPRECYTQFSKTGKILQMNGYYTI